MPMRTAPIGPRNGSGETVSAAETALMQRMSCAVMHVGREDRGDALRLVAVALRPERPDGAVGHACGQDGALRRAALALEEAAGDLPGGVHALLDVDREREEVRAFAGLRPALRRAENDGVAAADEDCSVSLLGDLPGLERNLLAADFDGHGNRHPCGVLSFDNGHVSPIPPLCIVKGGSLSQRSDRGVLAQTPPSVTWGWDTP